jgi:hypothetical protein
MKFLPSFKTGFILSAACCFITTAQAQQWSGSPLPTGDIYRTGNVGIGTAAPAYPLDVTGIVNATALQSGIVNSTAELYLQAYGSVIAGMNTNTFSVGTNTLSVSGIANFTSGSGNILTGSSLSSVCGYENTSAGVLNFTQGLQNNVTSGGLFGLNYALGEKNEITQTGSFFSKGLNFAFGKKNEIESDGEGGSNFALGSNNHIQNDAVNGANFVVGIENDLAYNNTDGNGANFITGFANTMDLIALDTPILESSVGINFLTGITNKVEGKSAACFGWGAGLGFSNTTGSFSIGMSSSLGSTFMQNNIPRSLMVGFSDTPTLFVKDGHVGINNTTQNCALYVDGRDPGAYGYAMITSVANDYGKAFAIHNTAGSGPAKENFLVYGNGETSITVDDDNLRALYISKRGSSSTDENFRVNGKGEVYARKVVVTTSGFPDYVFDKDYKLPSIGEVEQYIKENKHLPEVPSAAEAECEGIDVASMNNILLRKIEELTLYSIKQQAQIDMLMAAVNK